MRFHGLLVVRDEADIIVQSVRYALTWADAIYVFDTGSTDGTWELLQAIAREDRKLVLYKREPVYFRNDLRAVLFEQYRKEAHDGDWFVTVDADEFYHISPPVFVCERLRPQETAAGYQLYDFKLTIQECRRLRTIAAIEAERREPIDQRRRHYIAITYAEPRLFRYRTTMQWVPPKAPYNLGFMARERIPIRHYPNRDPLQMEARYRLRSQMRTYVGLTASPHWIKDWRDMLVDETDSGAGLEYWKPGSQLPAYNRINHLASPPKRMAQRVVHSMLLPVLDRMRPRYPANFQPERIPEGNTEE
jgi:hypothetical protein